MEVGLAPKALYPHWGSLDILCHPCDCSLGAVSVGDDGLPHDDRMKMLRSKRTVEVNATEKVE